MKRRALLAAVGGTSAASTLAGCVDTSSSWDGFDDCLPADPPAPRDCPDDRLAALVEEFGNHPEEDLLDDPRRDPVYEADPVYGRVAAGDGAYDLYVEPETVRVGDEVQIHLHPDGNPGAEFGNRTAYNVERATTDGWRELRVGWSRPAPAAASPIEPGIDTPPGGTPGGLRWSLELGDAGLSSRSSAVCPPVEPGIHRFVFGGIEDAPAVGVCFAVADS